MQKSVGNGACTGTRILLGFCLAQKHSKDNAPPQGHVRCRQSVQTWREYESRQDEPGAGLTTQAGTTEGRGKQQLRRRDNKAGRDQPTLGQSRHCSQTQCEHGYSSREADSGASTATLIASRGRTPNMEYRRGGSLCQIVWAILPFLLLGTEFSLPLRL